MSWIWKEKKKYLDASTWADIYSDDMQILNRAVVKRLTDRLTQF